MLLTLFSLFIGTGFGYLFRNHYYYFKTHAQSLQSYAVYLILFVSGVNFGSGRNIWNELSTVGGISLLFSLLLSIGSVLVTHFLLIIFKHK
jgi:uncharacterized transporter YbjL